tara:strand:- start:3581 stop:4807 length:1227 start_codon:yes stop_codon:yes gene_type:complete
MKKVIVLYLGNVFDEKEDLLGDQTPLEVAETPFFDHIYSSSYNGTLANPDIHDSFSLTSVLSILLGSEGFHHSSVLLAKGMGCDLKENDIIFKNNFVSLKPTAKSLSVMDPLGSSLSIDEKIEFTEFLNSNLFQEDGESFFLKTAPNGDSVFVYRKNNLEKGLVSFDQFHSPFEFTGREIDVFPKMEDQSKRFMYIMNESQMLLSKHPVVVESSKDNFLFPNSIWFYEGSYTRLLNRNFDNQTFGKTSVISSNLILKGFCSVYGMQFSSFENYELNSLEENDLIFIDKEASEKHVDPIDKVNTIQELDEEMKKFAEDFLKFDAHVLFLFNFPKNISNYRERGFSFLFTELENGVFKLPRKKFTKFDLLCMISNAISPPESKTSEFSEKKFESRKTLDPVILGTKLFKH